MQRGGSSGGKGSTAAGAPVGNHEPTFARHVPVLLAEVLAALDAPHGATIIDATFGAGGYSTALLERDAAARIVGFDRDPTAIADAAPLLARFGPRLLLVERPFAEMQAGCAAHGVASVDGVVLDIGVSSMQLDEAERGFSFRADGPLDMRMARDGRSAADLVNTLEEGALADLIHSYGEERFARPIARAIVAARRAEPITTTLQLAKIIGTVLKQRFGEIHPATRTFQALRIAVNDELGQLVQGLHAAEALLKEGGILAVVTFHSLEDRIVKQFFAARSGKGGGSRHRPVQAGPATFALAGKWPVVPGEAEMAANPRARSAKLRAGRRTALAAQPIDPALAALAALPVRQRGQR
jgi:16S rRNA (cytosine1402-N4)-methyltransferase